MKGNLRSLCLVVSADDKLNQGKAEEELYEHADGAQEILVKAAEKENRKRELYGHNSHSRSVDRHKRSIISFYNDKGDSKA